MGCRVRRRNAVAFHQPRKAFVQRRAARLTLSFGGGREGPALHAGASSGVRYRRGGGVVPSPYHHHGERQCGADDDEQRGEARSEEHTSELQSLMRTSYAVFCLKKK